MKRDDDSAAISIAGVRVRFAFRAIEPHRPRLFPIELLENGPVEISWRVVVTPAAGAVDDPPANEVFRTDRARLVLGNRVGRLELGTRTRRVQKDEAFTATLLSILRREGRLDIHAAAVSQPGRKGCLVIAGPKGSGKTSLAVAAAMRGWSFLSDDYIVAWRHESAAVATGFRSSFFLTPDTADRLPKSSAKGVFVASMNKRKYDPRSLFRGQHAANASIQAVIYPTVTDAANSRLTRLDSVDAFKRLLMHCPYLAADRGSKSCLPAARQIASRPTFVLESGRDILDPMAAERVLEAAYV